MILFPKFDLNYNTYVHFKQKEKKENYCKHSKHLNI
jgi:hypothetical protein